MAGSIISILDRCKKYRNKKRSLERRRSRQIKFYIQEHPEEFLTLLKCRVDHESSTDVSTSNKQWEFMQLFGNHDERENELLESKCNDSLRMQNLRSCVLRQDDKENGLSPSFDTDLTNKASSSLPQTETENSIVESRGLRYCSNHHQFFSSFVWMRCSAIIHDSGDRCIRGADINCTFSCCHRCCPRKDCARHWNKLVTSRPSHREISPNLDSVSL